MQSFGLTLCLQADDAKIAAYKEYHRAVWPEVLRDLHTVGILRMQIFLRERRMFMYIETADGFDLAQDFGRVNENATSREWNAIMATLQERAPEADPDEWWAATECVFDSDWPQHTGSNE